MAKRKKQLPLLESVTITDVAAEGKAIAKVDGMAVFVPYAVPGDVVDIQLTRKKHNYAEGKVVDFISYSENRVEPFCEHFGICGGCKWQMLPYDLQLKYKQKQVADNLTRIGKVELPEISPILGAPKTTFYRNKLEFAFSNRGWLTEEEIESGEFRKLGKHWDFISLKGSIKYWIFDTVGCKTMFRTAYETRYAGFVCRTITSFSIFAIAMV